MMVMASSMITVRTSLLLYNTEYVIQKYITNPLLWDGFKFHFRMYAILKADMSTYLYAKAFILTAGLKYDCNSDDIQKQITNLSLNKKIPGHPGQIPINVQEAYPKVCTISLYFIFMEFFLSTFLNLNPDGECRYEVYYYHDNLNHRNIIIATVIISKSYTNCVCVF